MRFQSLDSRRKKDNMKGLKGWVGQALSVLVRFLIYVSANNNIYERNRNRSNISRNNTKN